MAKTKKTATKSTAKKTAKKATKSTKKKTAKKSSAKNPKAIAETEIPTVDADGEVAPIVDVENQQDTSDRRGGDRRKKQRRRQIDPTTCERDYNEEEIEFMRAMDEYKRNSGRMFPTCSEILEVIKALGYVRPGAAEAIPTEGVSTLPATDEAAEADAVTAPTQLTAADYISASVHNGGE